MSNVEEVDGPPAVVARSVVVIAYAAILLAAAQSLTVNVFHDTHHDIIPSVIAGLAGVVAPALFAFTSHIAALMDFGNRKMNLGMRAAICAIATGFLYVSASSGTQVLKPVMGLASALVFCVCVDATAMVCLIILMVAEHRRAALKVWERQRAEREIGVRVGTFKTQTGGGRVRETPRETPKGNGGEGVQGNVLPAVTGNVRTPLALTEGNAAGDQEAGGELLQIGTKAVLSNDEIRLAAVEMAAALAVEGEEITNVKYAAMYGGKATRYSPIVGEVKAFFAPIAGAVRERRQADPNFGLAAGTALVAEMKAAAEQGSGIQAVSARAR